MSHEALCHTRIRSLRGGSRAATLRSGAVFLATPLAYVLTFLFLFVFGGMTGVAVATMSLDVHWHDTYFAFFDAHPNQRPFRTLYWTMTGLHTLHVLAGVGVLAILAVWILRDREASTNEHRLSNGVLRRSLVLAALLASCQTTTIRRA